MSAQRRRLKARVRRANVHRRGLCDGCTWCPQVKILDPDTGAWQKLEGVRSVEVSFRGRAG